MDHREREKRTEPEGPLDSAGREVAPPIEREHETYAGIFDEDERRERDRDAERR